MKSIIFKTAANYLLPITLAFSVWVLLRGHNSPGGGFVGGLMGACGYALYLFAYGAAALRKIIRVDLKALLALGIILILMSGLSALFIHEIFLTGVWFTVYPLSIEIGTPVIFDIGVYLIVLSGVLIMMLALQESHE